MMTSTAVLPNIAPRKIRVIGVPLDLGQSRRGVDMGPPQSASPDSKRASKLSATKSKTAATSLSPFPNRKKKATLTRNI